MYPHVVVRVSKCTGKSYALSESGTHIHVYYKI